MPTFSYNPTAFSGTSMHPVEATLYYSAGIMPALLGLHPVLSLGCIADCAFGAWLGHDGFQVNYWIIKMLFLSNGLVNYLCRLKKIIITGIIQYR